MDGAKLIFLTFFNMPTFSDFSVFIGPVGDYNVETA